MVEPGATFVISQVFPDPDGPASGVLRGARIDTTAFVGAIEIHALSEKDSPETGDGLPLDGRQEDDDLLISWMQSGFPVGPPRGALRADWRRGVFAWLLAILLHVLLVVGIIIYRDRSASLQVRLVRGTGAVAGSVGASNAQGPAGPLLPMPAILPARVQAAFSVALSDSTEQSQPEFSAAPIPQAASTPEAPALGLGPSPDTALPHFASRSLSVRKIAAAGPASRGSATTEPEPSAAVAAAGPPGGQIFKAPRPAGGGGVLGDPGGVDERGLPIPEYPAQSRRRHEEGLVEVNLQILPDGSVGAVRVITDPGFPRLVESAVAAAKRARFEPALRDGQPVIASLIVPYRFILR